MPCEVLCADQDTRTAGTICHDIHLATHGVAETLLFFSAVLLAQVQSLKYTANGGKVTSCLELQH